MYIYDLILQKIFRRHGFEADDIEFVNDRIKFKVKDVSKLELRKEGAPIPNKNDCNYHNYIYPEGFISNLEAIEVKFYPPEHPYAKRVNTIKIPSAIYKESAENANMIFGTNHTITKSEQTVLLTVDYSKGGGSTPANQLIEQLTSDLQPRIADADDINQGINYISDLGRILPLLWLELKKEIKNLLLLGHMKGPLLQLQDHLVSFPEFIQTRFIELDIKIFYDYIEKLVREEGYLVQPVRNYLKLDLKHWILADNDLLRNYINNNDVNAKKLKCSLENKNAPLFISTTSGNHAFAVKVDFQSNTLFLANPGGEGEGNCNIILESLKKTTGCNTVVQVVTQKLHREGDIPIDDLCTVDSLALAQMMMVYPNQLVEGCLNYTPLKTGVFITKALQEDGENSAHFTLTGQKNFSYSNFTVQTLENSSGKEGLSKPHIEQPANLRINSGQDVRPKEMGWGAYALYKDLLSNNSKVTQQQYLNYLVATTYKERHAEINGESIASLIMTKPEHSFLREKLSGLDSALKISPPSIQNVDENPERESKIRRNIPMFKPEPVLPVIKQQGKGENSSEKEGLSKNHTEQPGNLRINSGKDVRPKEMSWDAYNLYKDLLSNNSKVTQQQYLNYLVATTYKERHAEINGESIASLIMIKPEHSFLRKKSNELDNAHKLSLLPLQELGYNDKHEPTCVIF